MTTYDHLVFTAIDGGRLSLATTLVRATTAVPEDTLVEGKGRCIANEGRCGGHVTAVRFDQNVRWACMTCDAGGGVTAWERSPADRRRGPERERPFDARLLAGPVSTWPKISGAFTSYARPILAGLRPVPAEWQRALIMPATIWNAVVLADQASDPKWLDEVRARMSARSGTAMLADMLIARKRRLFADDFRTVEVDGVRLQGDTMWVNVTARDGRPGKAPN